MKQTIKEILTIIFGFFAFGLLFTGIGKIEAQAAAVAGASSVLMEQLEEIENTEHIGVMYASTRVNVREHPDTDSDIICVLDEYEAIDVWNIGNSEWYQTKSGYYIYKSLLVSDIPSYSLYSGLWSTFKSYTDYRLITAIDTPQYALQQKQAYTGDYGIRMVDGRYCVALASNFGCEIGRKFDAILENGTIIPCVMSDQKDDIDTDGIYTLNNGCATEFYVDSNILYHPAKHAGDLSEIPGWSSPVVAIRVWDDYV